MQYIYIKSYLQIYECTVSNIFEWRKFSCASSTIIVVSSEFSANTIGNLADIWLIWIHSHCKDRLLNRTLSSWHQFLGQISLIRLVTFEETKTGLVTTIEKMPVTQIFNNDKPHLDGAHKILEGRTSTKLGSKVQ